MLKPEPHMDGQNVTELVERAEKRAAEIFDQRMRDPRFRAIIAKYDGVLCEDERPQRYGVAE
jgi:hypothetical protein